MPLWQNFWRNTRFDPDTDVPRLSGQVYVVTGASSGIGLAVTAHLLKHDAAKIITLSSREDVALESIEQLKGYGDTSRVAWRQCNFKDLNNVKEVTQNLVESEKRIDAIILNAGIGVQDFAWTLDDLDSHFQIHVLSHLHLALSILPIIESTSAITGTPGRIVFVTSDTHADTAKSTRFAGLEEINTDVGKMQLYFRAKLAQVLVAQELDKKLQSRHVSQQALRNIEKYGSSQASVLVNAVHPGAYNRTPLVYQLKRTLGWPIGPIFVALLSPFMMDPMTNGCRSTLFAATPNDYLLNRSIHGQYIIPDREIVQPSKMAQDLEIRSRVWSLCLEILESKLGKLTYKEDFA